MRILLVCEGASDTPLIAHIQRLAVLSGIAEPEGATWTTGRRLVDKISRALETLGDFDLVFVHRDSDRPNPSARYSEIGAAVEQTRIQRPMGWHCSGSYDGSLADFGRTCDSECSKKAASQGSADTAHACGGREVTRSRIIARNRVLGRERNQRSAARQISPIPARFAPTSLGKPPRRRDHWNPYRHGCGFGDDTVSALRRLEG